MKRLLEEFKGKINLVVKFFPHRYKDYSRISALASCFAWKEGKFEEMHELLLSNSPKLDLDSLVLYGKSIGLNEKRMREAISGGECKDFVEKDIRLAERLGVYATPTLIVGTKRIVGVQSYEYLRELVEEELRNLRK